MTDPAEILMLTGIEWPCPDCVDQRIFVAPCPADAAGRGAEFACTDCGAAILIDPCALSAEPVTASEVPTANVA